MKMQNSESNLSLILQLERLCGDLGDKLNLERRIRSATNRNEELSHLLGRLKNQIFEEKELNLRLRSEIANLKLQEIVDHKKIQALLGLCNLDEPSVEIFLQKDLPEFRLLHSCGPKAANGLGLETEIEVLLIKIKALKAELNERTELLLCERDSLIEEKMILLKEAQSKKMNENQEISLLLDRLKHLQTMFIQNLSSSNKLDATSKSSKSTDILLIPKENVGSQTNIDAFESQTSTDRILPYHKSALIDLKSQLRRSQEAQQRLQNRVGILQNEIDKLNKQKSMGSSSNQNLNERIKILAARNKDLERRRQLENEGFRSDVKLLRENIKEIEKQLLKVILSFGGNKDFNVDLSKMEAYENSIKGADALLVRLRDLQNQLS